MLFLPTILKALLAGGSAVGQSARLVGGDIGRRAIGALGGGRAKRSPVKRRKASKPNQQGLLQSLLFGAKQQSQQRKQQPGRLDKLQAAADVAGIVDQSGATDLTNAAVSAVRGVMSKDRGERFEHFRDAGIRAFSAIPVVGDVAKLARAKKYGQMARSFMQPASASRTTSASIGSLLSRRSGPAPHRQAAVPRQATGLTPQEKLSMMGRPRDEIDEADRQKREQQQREIDEETAAEKARELRESFSKLTKGVVGAASAIIALPKVTQKFGEALVEARRHLGQYNGQLAAANARLDIQRVQLDMRTANRTAGSAANLSKDLRELREAMQPLKEMSQSFQNALGSLAINVATFVADIGVSVADALGIDKVVKSLEDWLGDQKNKQNEAMPLHSAVQQIIDTFGRDNLGRREPLPPL